ncbi:MAG TPA: acyltransferase family protein, partial [Candidatus Acidoferrales bacterium]|nr:acyltransferase family protein [Candidatus Acidoferrales bacterium]
YLGATALTVLFLTTNSRLDLRSAPIWEQLAAHLFLVHNISQATFSGLNGSFWSLAIEAQLYLLYPLLLVMVGRFGWRQTMVALACCEFVIRGADGLVQTMGAENAVWGHISWLFAASPLGYWFSWTLGARLADAYLNDQPLPFARVPIVPFLALALLSYFIRPMLPSMFVLSAVVTTIAVSRLLGKAQSGVRMDTVQPKGWTPNTGRVFSLNVLSTIGLWSYSIYLLHQPLLNALSLFLTNVVSGPYRNGAAAFLYFVAGWLIIIPICGLWYHVFELPGIALGKWIIQKRVPDKSSATPLVYRPKTSFYHMAGVLVIVVAGILLLTTKLNERDSESELELAEFLTAKHRYVAALKHYQAALEHDENSVDALNNSAWMLATAPNPRLRDGKTAVELASKACELTGYKKPFYIVTLAAAYAEAGRFDEAITNSQTARVLALKHGQIEMATRIDQLVELYQAGKPFHETADSR